jgi:hypothetical protein
MKNGRHRRGWGGGGGLPASVVDGSNEGQAPLERRGRKGRRAIANVATSHRSNRCNHRSARRGGGSEPTIALAVLGLTVVVEGGALFILVATETWRQGWDPFEELVLPITEIHLWRKISYTTSIDATTSSMIYVTRSHPIFSLLLRTLFLINYCCEQNLSSITTPRESCASFSSIQLSQRRRLDLFFYNSNH